MNILTVYFSRKGNNWWNGGIKNLPTGNAAVAAEMIRSAVGGESFEIEADTMYPSDYTLCTIQAKKESLMKEPVPVKRLKEDLETYDVIFVCYPNWWGTYPRAVDTFFRHYHLKGTRLFPFCSHEGSGLGKSVRDLQALCPDAVIGQGLAVRGSETVDQRKAIMEWAVQSIRMVGDEA